MRPRVSQRCCHIRWVAGAHSGDPAKWDMSSRYDYPYKAVRDGGPNSMMSSIEALRSLSLAPAGAGAGSPVLRSFCGVASSAYRLCSSGECTVTIISETHH